jgi:hypothetical protein
VVKRYSDFAKLVPLLFQDNKAQCKGLAAMLPPKVLGRISDEVVAYRQKQLEQLLNSLLKRDLVESSRERVEDFLDMDHDA